MAYSSCFPDILSRSCRQSFMQHLMGHCMKIWYNFIILTNEDDSVEPAQCADLPEPSLLANTLTKYGCTSGYGLRPKLRNIHLLITFFEVNAHMHITRFPVLALSTIFVNIFYMEILWKTFVQFCTKYIFNTLYMRHYNYMRAWEQNTTIEITFSFKKINCLNLLRNLDFFVNIAVSLFLKVLETCI